MACFTAPLAEAVIVKVVEKNIEKKGGKEASDKIPLARKIKWLSTMLFGGSALLAFEHIWHGEITAWFPFLTAMSDKEDTVTMLKEIATVGVSMAVLITAVWLIMCKVADTVLKNKPAEQVKEAKV
ncbi:hypothetical protein SAMN06296952_1541 [Oscillospiraceae bacterium]|nr:hypothetical protein SAMN06296952_1541 [Oscillospiraceae bacterium]